MNDLKGHDVFDDGPGPVPVPMHSLKSKHLRGHDVFGDVGTPRRPSTALSDLKRSEMSGQDIFADGQDAGYKNNVQGEMRFSEARKLAVAGMAGSDIFADGAAGANGRTSVASTRPPEVDRGDAMF